MPNSRKPRGHHQPAAIPARQRTKGRIVWALLAGVFGLLIGFFASSDGYMAPIIGGLVGAAVGYVIGKTMEKEV
ncbi:MAG: hypothetical protein C4329_02640 [Chitinophagaceae bacterium]